MRRVWGLGLQIYDLGSRIQGSGVRAHGSVFSVQGLELETKVWSLPLSSSSNTPKTWLGGEGL